MSAARLTLADVDQLIDKLERASPEQGDWRAAFDRLHDAYVRAREFDRTQIVYNILLLGALLYAAVRLVQTHWNYTAISHELNFSILAALLLLNLYQFVLSRRFPVLRRKERVTAQLRFFGADIPDERTPLAERIPPEVALALVKLERAKSPVGLRPAYETVEKWQLRPRRWSPESICGAVLFTSIWLFALFAALSSDVPEFWRGAAFMLVVVIALYAMSRRANHVSRSERVEAAISRWRHLVPAMRDASP